MRVVVIGAGAVGGVIGGLLARAGHTVAFVARGEARAAIRARGLSIATPSGAFTTGPLAAEEEPSALGRFDLVVVAVKAWQVAAMAPSLAPLLGEQAMVMTVQNGVEAAGRLAAALGEQAVVGSICHVLATREGPAAMRYASAPPLLTLGERSGGTSERLERLAEALRAAGMTAVVSPEIAVVLWTKLLFVEPLGSVGAVTRATADVLRAIPETRALLVQAMREVQAVAAGVGVSVPDANLEQALARVDGLPAGATASMHRDLLEGRPSELEDQTGAVVRIGKKTGVPRPVHDFLYASLLPQARAAVRGDS
ncbi:MAG TPA: 2-dehydropantoate 2-reductase [Polyangiaceae bacterium]|jgi:2-dehydropantoate 2-reductase